MALNKIAIIGAGIGGLASAILLSRAGFEVSILEQAPSAAPVGAGFLLQPPGQMVLDKIGVLETVAQVSVPIEGLQSKTISGKTLLDLSYRDLKGAPRKGLGIQRSIIYDALLKELYSTTDVQIYWGVQVEECFESGDSAMVCFNDQRKSFDLCILSAGTNSLLSSKLFRRRVRRPYEWGCLWTTVNLPGALSPNILHQRCSSSKRMMGILPVHRTNGGYEAALYWSEKVASLESLDDKKFEGVKENIQRFWPEVAPSVEPIDRSRFIVARYNDVWMPKPFGRRLVAIGDIAHGTSPQLGQGCTMALLDAYSLSLALQRHLQRRLNRDHSIE